MVKTRTYEQWLRDNGKRVVQEGDKIRGVRVLHIVKPSLYTRVVTECPRCQRVSVLFMGNFANGRARCSFGCFRHKQRKKAWVPGE